MRRTGAWGVVAAAVVLCTAGLAGTSSAVMKPPIDGAGTVTCNVTGTLTFDPALSANGPAVPTTVTLKAHLAGCTGTGDGANVKSGTATVSGQSPTNDCATVLLAKPSGSRSGPLRWVAQPHTPKLNPSTIEFDGGSSSQGPPIIADAAGSSTAGSFSGDGVA